ncbi:MAG: hypothetical protein K1X28_03425 [Parachlamydiales bacterium]|nr:hypothetical protein [Parachlamydiales bacterium]
MNSIKERGFCERVNHFIHDHGFDGAKIAAAAGIVTKTCGPVIAGLGLLTYSGYQIYKKLTKPHPYAPHLKSQLFRRLSPQVQKQIVAKVERLPPLDLDTIQALREGNADHPVFKQENWTDVAMKAYFENQIEASTLHRLMIFAACRNEVHNHLKSNNHAISINESNQCVTSVKVFEPGGRGIKFLKQALAHNTLSDDDDEKEGNGTIDSFLNEDQWNQVLSRLPKDAQFFLVPLGDPEDTPELYSAIENIKRALDKKRIFLVKIQEGNLKWAILPPDLLMEILKVKYGEENVPRALNVFGEREIESLSGNSRPVRVPGHPYSLCPKIIHEGAPATDLAFYLHDIFYHLLIESSMGQDHRKLWIDLAKWVKMQNPKAFLKLLDKDMREYSQASKYSKSDRFWLTLARMDREIPGITHLILLYIFKGKCEGINFEQFHKLNERIMGHHESRFAPQAKPASESASELRIQFQNIKDCISVIEKMPGIADMEYQRYLARVNPPRRP